MEQPDRAADGAAQASRFLYLYALAVSGGALAYVPFLTIVLPVHVSKIAPANTLDVLAYAAFAGAIAASLANILFGWLSDRTGTRLPWIGAGLLASNLLLIAMPLASSPAMLIAMIVVWQLGLNMMLAPLSAWAGDCVPDAQKGLLGGLLALAPALGAMSGTLVTLPGIESTGARLAVVAGLVTLMVAPVLLAGKPRPMPQLMAPTAGQAGRPDFRHPASGSAIRMWLARLLVQIAEASLFAFLLLWFRSLDPAFRESDMARIFTAVLAAAAIAALVIGRWSDRAGRPILPLVAVAAVAGMGLLIMALAPDRDSAIGGYVVFGLTSSVFLSLHSSQTLRVLPAPQSRGRDLALFNLTNTVPSMIMPWLTLALVPRYGFDALFVLLAGLAGLACALLLSLERTGISGRSGDDGNSPDGSGEPGVRLDPQG